MSHGSREAARRTKKKAPEGAFSWSLPVRLWPSTATREKSQIVVRLVGLQRFARPALPSLAQFLAGLEMRYVLLRYQHLFTRFRITPYARRTAIEAEAAKAANFDAMAVGKRLRHRIEHRLHGEIRAFQNKLRKSRCQRGDKIRFGHTAADLLRLTGSGRRAWPSAAHRGSSCR